MLLGGKRREEPRSLAKTAQPDNTVATLMSESSAISRRRLSMAIISSFRNRSRFNLF